MQERASRDRVQYFMSDTDNVKDVFVIIEKISSNEFVKQAMESALVSVLGPIGPAVLSVVGMFLGAEEDRLEKELKEINLKLDEVNTKLDEFGNALRGIGSQINSVSKQLSSDIKFQNFNLYFVNIKSSIDYFNKKILKFTGSKEEFLKKLDNFIEDYEKNHYEDKLIRLAIEDIAGQPSLISSYINALEGSKDHHAISSTMQSVFELYLTIISQVSKGDAMMNLCYTLQNQLRNVENLLEYNRRSSLTDELMTSMVHSMKTLSGISHRTSFLSLNTPLREVKLRNVIQYFWQNERELTGAEDTCYYTCYYFKFRKYNDNGCYGAVRNCEFKISVFNHEYVYPVRNYKKSLGEHPYIMSHLPNTPGEQSSVIFHCFSFELYIRGT